MVGRYFANALLICAALFGAAAGAAESGKGGKGGGAARTFVVGFAQDTLANDFRAAQVRQLAAAFARRPHINFVFSDGEGSTAKQVSDVEEFISRRVDLLIVSPRDGNALAPVIERAAAQGIPVMLLTRMAATERYTTFVAPDDRAIAREAAEFLARELGRKGRVLVLQGVPTASTAIARTEGFAEGLARYPKMSVAAVVAGNYLRADALKAMEDVIERGVEFDAIFAQSDSMATGARMALLKAGRDPSRLPIVGFDYIPEAREAIRRGEQRASFVYPTCADEAARVADELLAGRKVPRRVMVPSRMVTSANVERVETIFR
jgi:ribose transport system substrate-binding protein